MKKQRKRPKIFTTVFLVMVALVQIFPLYWMITFSLKGNNEIFGGNIIGLPKLWRWDNYFTVFKETNIPLYLLNTVIVTALTIVFTVLLSAMVSYAIARFIWALSKTIYILFLMGMMIPVQAVLLPLFINLKPVLNTYTSLVLPYVAFGMPQAVLIMVGVLQGIPKELEEAAFIDGANIYQIFVKIILPLLKSTIATISILTFVSSWNELMISVTFINSERFKTITVGVLDMVGKYSTKWGLIGAGLAVATIPTVITYIFLSDNVQKSLIEGAIKG